MISVLKLYNIKKKFDRFSLTLTPLRMRLKLFALNLIAYEAAAVTLDRDNFQT